MDVAAMVQQSTRHRAARNGGSRNFVWGGANDKGGQKPAAGEKNFFEV